MAKEAARQFVIECAVCSGRSRVRVAWVDREVACPECEAALQVPAPPVAGQVVRARRAGSVARRLFNFACPRCETLLETDTGQSSRPGQCPSCGARFDIPFISSRSGKPDAARLHEGESDDPTPSHAYAVAGELAPRIGRRPDGTSYIECPRCEHINDIDVDNCERCGTPFSADGSTAASAPGREAGAVAALVLGIIALPAAQVFIPAVIAIMLGFHSLRLGSGTRIPRTGLIGMILGFVSLTIGLVLWVF